MLEIYVNSTAAYGILPGEVGLLDAIEIAKTETSDVRISFDPAITQISSPGPIPILGDMTGNRIVIDGDTDGDGTADVTVTAMNGAAFALGTTGSTDGNLTLANLRLDGEMNWLYAENFNVTLRNVSLEGALSDAGISISGGSLTVEGVIVEEGASVAGPSLIRDMDGSTITFVEPIVLRDDPFDPAIGTVSIVQSGDDADAVIASVIGLAVGRPDVSEGTSVVYTITRDGLLETTQSFGYTLAGLDPADLDAATATAGTITFNPGEAVKTLTFLVVEDDLAEGAETASLTLETLAGGLSTPTVSGLPTQVVFRDGPVQFVVAESAGAIDDTGTVDPGTDGTAPDEPDTTAIEPTALADTLRGTLKGDRIDALGGDDELWGFAGGDVLIGNMGNDRLYGGADADELFGGAGKDVLAGQGGADQLFGEAGGDRLSGGGQGDRLFGGGGRDILSGGGGSDVLLGQGGADRLSGNAGRDRLQGGAKGDQLFGQGGRDRLQGDGGRDRLDGGSGTDVLIGGGGRDTFVFNAKSGKDLIRDFRDGVDRIDVSAFDKGFGALKIRQFGSDTMVEIGRVDIQLLNVDADDIGRSDFIF